MRELFRRTEDDKEVIIEHNPSAYGYSNKYGWLFSLFIKFDASDQKSERLEDFLELKETLIGTLEHNESAKYAGSRIADGWSELYFYAADSKGLETAVAHILKESGFAYESSVVRDAKWDFHYKNLLPNDFELACIQSEEILKLLEEEGDDASVVREVEFYLSFDTQGQKERYLESEIPKDFSYKDDVSSEEFANGIALSKEQTTDKEAVLESVKTLYESVQKVHGNYEGWSTTLVEKEE